MPKAFHLRRAVAVAGRSKVTAEAAQLVVDVLHAGSVLYAEAVGVGGAFLALGCNRWKESCEVQEKFKKQVESKARKLRASFNLCKC